MFTIKGLLGCKTKFKITPMSTKEIWDISQALRDEDKQEILRTSGRLTFNSCIVDLILRYNHPVYKITYGEEEIGMGGFYKAKDKWRVWLVFTPAYERHKIQFLRFAKRNLNYLNMYYGVLTNVVWLKNTEHVVFLNWLGAKWIPLDDEFAIFELGDESS